MMLCAVGSTLTGTFTYLLADVVSRQGVLIDSVAEQHARDLALIQELGIELVASIDTHAHADHVTGSWLKHQVTGDALLVRGSGRSDFQQGDPHVLYRSITEQILSLPESCLLYPGDDYSGRTVTSVAEEKAFNARLGAGADENDFVGHMANMKLPHPQRIAEALPGNMRSGKLRQSDPAPAWSSVAVNFAGLPQLTPAWVMAQRSEVTLVDVRSREEFDGPNGRIAGSIALPLPDLNARRHALPTQRPLVLVCRSGSRSALATQQLLKAGHQQVANLSGGLLRWQAEGHPLER